MCVKKVENKNRYRTAHPYYYYVQGDNKHYLFTESQVVTAQDRAKNNPEDVPAPESSFNLDLYGGLSIGLLVGALVTSLLFFFLG